MARKLKSGLDKKISEENLSCYIVNEIEDMMKIIVEEFLPLQFEENCTVRYFKKMFVMLNLRKKYLSYAKSFIGMDEKNVCVFFFIQNHVSKLLTNINQCAKIFKKEEEDRTNVKHIRRRRKIMEYVNKIRQIYYITFYSLNKSCDHHATTYNERTLRFTTI